jgi:protein TonB
VARRRGFQGNVVLEVLVGPLGNVIELHVLSSSGYSILDRAAKSSVKNWTFEPGMRGQEKVEMWVRVPIRFELK